MLISNSYFTYDTNGERIIGGTANISSSSDATTIFEVELININKTLTWTGMLAYLNQEDQNNSKTRQSVDIYINDDNLSNEEAYAGFGFINIKEA